ncbi:hypothetical protein ACWKWP_15910 [Agromyces soli]
MSHREPAASGVHAVRAQLGQGLGMRGCVHGTECSSERPGHRLHAMQSRLAAIAASKWVDAIVAASDDDGFVELLGLDGTVLRIWHHAALDEVLAVGDPVAVHSVYGVLVAGGNRLSVALV